MTDEPQIRDLPCRNCGAPVELAPDWRERVFDAVREANEALGRGTLDAAWREAIEAMPDGYFGPRVEPRFPDRWRAWIDPVDGDRRQTHFVWADTEPDALQALAAELRADRLRERA